MVVDKKLSPEEEIVDALEQDLRELESYIQDFWRFLPLPICYINPVHNILDVDDCLVNFSGYKSTEIVGEDIKILFKENTEIEDLKKKILKEESAPVKRINFLTKDKKEIPVSISAMARKSEEGEVIGYFLSIVDLTETVNFQEKLQEEVDKKTRELQEKVEELEAFHKIAVGRELKMIELKEEIAKFKKNNL
ncbi:MAG: PAS domain-containing protein [Candidatus Pacebacteria bacterium]|nr:PAS domain-containing protein [Candidatus Paceibacterota bacterium]